LRIIGAIRLKRSYTIAVTVKTTRSSKYAALVEAGIPKDDVKIAILKNFVPNETHAAVATRIDGQWLILDNRTLR
jgi:predicted transglutaminase-like cysteine proteinase